MNKNLLNSFGQFDKKKVFGEQEYSGILGATIGGGRKVEVPNRKGYVYVRLRNNPSEIIQAWNNTVSPVYDLPVIVSYASNEWVIRSRDSERYANNWSSNSPFLPSHGNAHSFQKDLGGGGDIVWVDSQQILPLLVIPSGSGGGPNVLVSPAVFRYNSGDFGYIGDTGTASLLPYKPTDSTAAMVLVYVDSDNGNIGFLVNSGSYFSAAATGTADILPYLPDPQDNTQIPLAGIRLVSGTSAIGWDNIYDLRQFLSVPSTGTSGGGGGGGAGSTAYQENGAFIVSGSSLNFARSFDVTASGTNARVELTTVVLPKLTGTALPPTGYTTMFMEDTYPYPIFMSNSNAFYPGELTNALMNESTYKDWVWSLFYSTGSVNDISYAYGSNIILLSEYGTGSFKLPDPNDDAYATYYPTVHGFTLMNPKCVTGTNQSFDIYDVSNNLIMTLGDSQIGMFWIGSSPNDRWDFVQLNMSTGTGGGDTYYSTPNTVTIQKDGGYIVSGTAVNFIGQNVWVNNSGTVAEVIISGSGGGGDTYYSTPNTITVLDDDTYKVSGTSLNFNGKYTTVSATGTMAYITENDTRWTTIQRRGFSVVDYTDISFDDAVNDFTLAIPAPYTFRFMRSGVEFTKSSGNRTIHISGSLGLDRPNDGNTYVFIDNDNGNLNASSTVWDLSDGTVLPVSILIFNNALTPKYWLEEERHTNLIDTRFHRWAHTRFGTQWISGGTIAGYTVAPVSPVDNDNTFSISVPTIADEDLFQTLNGLSKPSGTALTYWNWFPATGTWNWRQSPMPYLYTSGSYINYNNGGTLTAGQNNKWYNSYLLFTNIQGDSEYIMIPGQGEFSSAADAYAESPSSFTWTGFTIAEAVIAYQFTWQTNNAYGTKGKCRLARAPQRIQTSITTVQSTTASAQTISADNSTWDGVLSGTSANVQAALNTLDDHLHGVYKDLTGTTGNATVMKILGNAVADTTPTHGQSLIWVTGTTNQWTPRGIDRQTIMTYEGPLVTGTGTLRFYNRINPATIYEVFCSIVPPPPSSIIIDVHKDGTTLFTTQSNRTTVISGAFTGVTTTIENSSFAYGSYLTLDIDQGAATHTGSMSVQVMMR